MEFVEFKINGQIYIRHDHKKCWYEWPKRTKTPKQCPNCKKQIKKIKRL
jgi:predicted Zn-ribbon and HTH transcriptional regulator